MSCKTPCESARWSIAIEDLMWCEDSTDIVSAVKTMLEGVDLDVLMRECAKDQLELLVDVSMQVLSLELQEMLRASRAEHLAITLVRNEVLHVDAVADALPHGLAGVTPSAMELLTTALVIRKSSVASGIDDGSVRDDACNPEPMNVDFNRWVPPRVKIAQLPIVLREVADEVMCASIVDIELLTSRVGTTLGVNLWNSQDNSELRGKLLRVAESYYCNGDGFEAALDEASAREIISEMEKIVSPMNPKKDIPNSSSLAETSRCRGKKTPVHILPVYKAERRVLGSNLLPYSHLLMDKAWPDHSESLQERLLYAIKHRLDIPSQLYSRSHGNSQGQLSHRRGSRCTAANQASPHLQQPSVYDAMVKLQTSLSAPARSEVARLLLDRRFLVPFMVPKAAKGVVTEYCADITSLEFVDTAVAHNGENSVVASLARDCSYMRVAVVSERSKDDSRTKDWISSIFHVHSFYSLDRDYSAAATEFSPTAELGWGFLHDRANNTFAPVMVLHVIGDYTAVAAFVEGFADAVVVDAVASDNEGCLPTKINLKSGAMLKWTYRDPDLCDVQEQAEPVFVMSLRCTNKTSTLRISEYLLEEIELSKRKATRMSLSTTVEGMDGIERDALDRIDFRQVLDGVDASTLRSEDLILQSHFAAESQLLIQQLHESNCVTGRRLQNRIEECQNARLDAASGVENHVMISLFKRILSLDDEATRVATVMDFERWLSASCEGAAHLKRSKYRAALEQYRLNSSKANRRTIDETLEAWNMAVLGMEHLWRELSHLYAADPNDRSNLTEMAAQHLLDGFSLELMDGDAAMVNMEWIQGVLNSLYSRLPCARVLVLSVMGVQSSGKSTLLNYMFGVRLRTSVSRCTRGVSMQLLMCKDRKEYDYIVLLDTEGVRAPECIGRDDSVWRDNRMATFAMLPADATIVLTKGESTDTINEILPIVLSVHLDSELAHENGGQLPSKVFFTFNQVDLAEQSKMENIVHMLMRQLNKNASIIDKTRRQTNYRTLDETSDRPKTYFQSLTVDIENEASSDVRILGTIKAQPFAPHDTPVPDFGHRVCVFREHLHRRVCSDGDWEPRTLKQFEKCMTLVWDCIQHSNFNLIFKEAFEKANYDRLSREFMKCCQELSSHYAEAFDKISKKIQENARDRLTAAGATVQGSLSERAVTVIAERYSHEMNASIQQHVFAIDAQLKTLTDDKNLTKWRTTTISNWNQKKIDQKKHWLRMIQDQVDVAFLYDNFVEVYKSKLRAEANKLFGNGGMSMQHSDSQLEQLFENVFSRLVDEANEKHPPFHKDVNRKIYQVCTQTLSTIRWQPNQEHADEEIDAVDEGSWIMSMKHKIRGWIAGGSSVASNEKATKARLRLDIITRIQLIISTVKRYSDEVVLECFDVAMTMLLQAEGRMAVGTPLKRQVYNSVYKILCEELKTIQQKWDEGNSVSVKFSTCKESMKNYFFVLSKGFRGADFLLSTVSNWLKYGFDEGFQRELVAYIGRKLKHERWVSDPDVMQAHVDNSLLAHVESNEVDRMIELIEEPREHYNKIISALIQSQIETSFATVLEKFVTTLQNCINDAAEAAYHVSTGRSKTFLRTLASSMRCALSPASSRYLLEDSPNENDENMMCDSQPASIFADSTGLNIRRAALEAISSLPTIGDFDLSYLSEYVAFYIMDHGYGAVDGIMPRCGEPCPICKCPCTEYYGHEGSESNKCHDSYHQPTGLTGWHNTDTKELGAGSCAINAKKRVHFIHNGRCIPFSDFHVTFPDWKSPKIKRPLPLREYIFMKYQDDLVRIHGGDIKVCPAIPHSYNHSLEQIKAQIKELIG